MARQQGRRIGSKVKLTPFARTTYPQFAGKVGRIVKRVVLTVSKGLSPAYRSYRIGYFVRFDGEKRDYFLGSNHLMKAG